MAIKKSKTPEFTAQVRVVLIVDVVIEDSSLENATAFAKTLKLSDIISEYDDGVSEVDHSLKVTGIYDAKAWDTSQ